MAGQAQRGQSSRRQLEDERWQLEAEDLARRGFSVLDRSDLAKSVAGDLAGGAGVPVGIGRGVVKDAKAVADGVGFLGRLATSDAARQSAVSAARQITDDGVAYVRSRTHNSDLFMDDLRCLGKQWNKDVNPAATPVADSFTDEIARRFGVGMNQGELAYNVGTVMATGGRRV